MRLSRIEIENFKGIGTAPSSRGAQQVDLFGGAKR